ncbi:MAG: ABC transporter permease subunit [Dehalococcoidia bacterium]|nr:ABC transporter permease subunit [Dehalococcoidia bacterium]
MNAEIVQLTLRQQLTLGRLIATGLLLLQPLIVGIVFMLFDTNEEPVQFAADMLDVLVLTGILPIIALLAGTGVMGNEVQNGTLPYLLLKPISRVSILLSKTIVAVITTAAVLVPTILVSGLMIGTDADTTRVALGFAVAAAFGAAIYGTFFVLLSLLTSRAFIVGLIYIFLWEAAITNIFPGVQYLSIRHYSRAVADAIAAQPDGVLDSELAIVPALVLAIVAAALSLWLATERLRGYQVGDTSG